jgi:uncharacterized protein
MMILVADTNVLVSALLSPGGPPARILHLWKEERFDVALSGPLLEELEQVLRYPKVQKALRQPLEWVDRFLQRLRMAAVMTDPVEFIQVIEADPDDDRVLECAVSAEAAYVISGDDHLLSFSSYPGSRLCSIDHRLQRNARWERSMGAWKSGNAG